MFSISHLFYSRSCRLFQTLSSDRGLGSEKVWAHFHHFTLPRKRNPWTTIYTHFRLFTRKETTLIINAPTLLTHFHHFTLLEKEAMTLLIQIPIIISIRSGKIWAMHWGLSHHSMLHTIRRWTNLWAHFHPSTPHLRKEALTA